MRLVPRRRLPTLLGGAATPRAVSGLALWLEDGELLYQTSTGTTPAAAAGDPVGKRTDLSGNNAHATQATAGQRPAVQIDERTGRLTVRHDGTNDVLTGALAATPTAFTVFVVLRASGAGGTDLGIWRLASDAAQHGLTHTNAATLTSYFSDGTITRTESFPTGRQAIVVSVYDGQASPVVANLYLAQADPQGALQFNQAANSGYLAAVMR